MAQSYPAKFWEGTTFTRPTRLAIPNRLSGRLLKFGTIPKWSEITSPNEDQTRISDRRKIALTDGCFLRKIPIGKRRLAGSSSGKAP
jgi:hypothetical protein